MANIIVSIFSETSQPQRCCALFHTGHIDHLSVKNGAAAASPIVKNNQAQQHDGTKRQILGSGEREEWLTPSAEQRPDRNGGSQRRRRGGRTAGINLESQTHQPLLAKHSNCHQPARLPRTALCSYCTIRSQKPDRPDRAFLLAVDSAHPSLSTANIPRYKEATYSTRTYIQD